MEKKTALVIVISDLFMNKWVSTEGDMIDAIIISLPITKVSKPAHLIEIPYCLICCENSNQMVKNHNI